MFADALQTGNNKIVVQTKKPLPRANRSLNLDQFMLRLVLLQPSFGAHALICARRLGVCHREHLNRTNQILGVTAEMFGFLYCSCLVGYKLPAPLSLCAAWRDACYIFNVVRCIKSGAVVPVSVCFCSLSGLRFYFGISTAHLFVSAMEALPRQSK